MWSRWDSRNMHCCGDKLLSTGITYRESFDTQIGAFLGHAAVHHFGFAVSSIKVGQVSKNGNNQRKRSSRYQGVRAGRSHSWSPSEAGHLAGVHCSNENGGVHGRQAHVAR